VYAPRPRFRSYRRYSQQAANPGPAQGRRIETVSQQPPGTRRRSLRDTLRVSFQEISLM
jgi:hypothetical protein